MPAQKPNRPPAMTDVAALAGVSHQTVSRVLNKKDDVRPETRKRVLAAIDELGYRRNETARALATRRSNIIGLITTAHVNYGPAQTLFGVELAARDGGYFVAVAALDEFTEEGLSEALDMLLGLGVAGIVVIAPVQEVAAGLGRVSLNVPIVVVSSAWTPGDSKITRVGIDQHQGATLAVDHLIKSGAKTIAHIAGPKNWFDATERQRGWESALENSSAERGVLLRGDWTADSGYALAKEIMAGELPDAIFVSNDQMALGALYALKEGGVAVPEKVRVVGFDNEPGTAFFSPPLTTVQQDFDAVGREAIKTVAALVDGHTVRDRQTTPELIVRESA